MDEVGDLKAYEVFHLGGSYKASQNLTLNATLYNVFDKDFTKGQTYTTNTGATGWASDYIQSNAATTGTLEEGRRLWLSANLTF
ncbi:TonB dependent receptor [compost metagenome]